jgi:hypothetical protein
MQPFKLFLVILCLSCKSTTKHPDIKQDLKKSVSKIIALSFDTLPNGQRLLDNTDSAYKYYYKEVVGSDTLKGGYITCYGVDDSSYYFYLRHGDTLRLLNKREKIVGAWSLGILEEDFDKFFITRIDNGNGSAETYQVFDKKNGSNLLGDKVEAWNFKYFHDTLYFLYDNHTVNLIDNYYIDRKVADTIFLYNAVTGRRQRFKLPPKKPSDIIYYGIKKITKNSLTISSTEQYSGNEELVKYSR